MTMGVVREMGFTPLQRPPLFGMAVAEGARKLHPLAGIVRTFPGGKLRYLRYRAGLSSYGTVPSVGGF